MKNSKKMKTQNYYKLISGVGLNEENELREQEQELANL